MFGNSHQYLYKSDDVNLMLMSTYFVSYPSRRSNKQAAARAARREQPGGTQTHHNPGAGQATAGGTQTHRRARGNTPRQSQHATGAVLAPTTTDDTRRTHLQVSDRLTTGDDHRHSTPHEANPQRYGGDVTTF